MGHSRTRSHFAWQKLSIVLSMSLLLATGCAHVRSTESLDLGSSGNRDLRQGRSFKNNVTPRTIGDLIQQNKDTKPSNRMVKYSDLVINGVKLKNTEFDFPISINSRVENWVEYFTGRGRKFFAKYLERSEFFIPYIVPILQQNGMPEDLVYLAMIESGFNNHARSFARAVGPWQFMSATGKRYGLMVNWWVDERRDIRKSTLAAVEYLKDLYNMFQSWELAAASYNAGENKVGRAIQRYGTKDFWQLSQYRFLKPETRDYVPKIIAAALISKNRELFGFEAPMQHPAADETVAGDGEIVKVIKTDKPEVASPEDSVGELASALEDEILGEEDDEEDSSVKEITPNSLLVSADGAVESNNVTEQVQLAKPVPTPHVSKDGQVGGEELVEFDVKSPADLLKVARAAGLSYQTVKALNPELLRWCTPPTLSSFRLKLPSSTKDRFLQAYNHAAFPREVKFMTYKVRRGETITHVARHFGIHVDPIADLNGVSSRMPLRKGVNVLLPIPLDRSRSMSSLDLLDPPSKRRRFVRRHRKNKYYKITYKRRESARSTSKKIDPT